MIWLVMVMLILLNVNIQSFSVTKGGNIFFRMQTESCTLSIVWNVDFISCISSIEPTLSNYIDHIFIYQSNFIWFWKICLNVIWLTSLYKMKCHEKLKVQSLTLWGEIYTLAFYIQTLLQHFGLLKNYSG